MRKQRQAGPLEHGDGGVDVDSDHSLSLSHATPLRHLFRAQRVLSAKIVQHFREDSSSGIGSSQRPLTQPPTQSQDTPPATTCAAKPRAVTADGK